MAALTVVVPQHMEALQKAHRIRLARAEMRHDVAEGRTTVAEVVADVPPHAETMMLCDLLALQHRWGKARVRRFCVRVSISEARTLGALTERQRRVVAEALAGPS